MFYQPTTVQPIQQQQQQQVPMHLHQHPHTHQHQHQHQHFQQNYSTQYNSYYNQPHYHHTHLASVATTVPPPAPFAYPQYNHTAAPQNATTRMLPPTTPVNHFNYKNDMMNENNSVHFSKPKLIRNQTNILQPSHTQNPLNKTPIRSVLSSENIPEKRNHSRLDQRLPREPSSHTLNINNSANIISKKSRESKENENTGNIFE